MSPSDAILYRSIQKFENLKALTFLTKMFLKKSADIISIETSKKLAFCTIPVLCELCNYSQGYISSGKVGGIE